MSLLRCNIITCPLCTNTKSTKFYQDKYRVYLSCECCKLLFVPPESFLSPEEEKARYDTHENSPEDEGYRNFLSKMFLPMQKRIKPASYGIDFGSGPGPTLSVMFREAGHNVVDYDPFYNKHTDLLEDKYDFITATEVVEHLYNPIRELDMLWKMLKPGGWMGIMTCMYVNLNLFDAWYYKDDPTHVCFFSHETFKWLATWLNSDVFFTSKNVVLLKKLPNAF